MRPEKGSQAGHAFGILRKDVKMGKDQAIKVLLVDDEERFRSTTTATLENRGFQVTTAGDGFAAIEEVKQSEFDIVVLDVRMPGMDGYATLLEMRRLKSGLPVIMLTAYGFPVFEHKTHYGQIYHLSKPCDMEALASMIEYVFARATDSKESEQPRVLHARQLGRTNRQ